MKKLFKPLLILSIILAVTGAGIALAGVCMGGSLRSFWSGSKATDASGGEVIQNTENIKELSIEMSKGEMVIQQGNYKEIMISADDSRMKVNTTTDGDSLHIEVNGRWSSHGGAAMVYLPSSLKLEQLDIQLGAGSIDADRLAADNISIQVGAGEFQCEESLQAKQLHCEVGAGDIEIEKVKSEKTDLSCSVGNIGIAMEGNMQDYYLDGESMFGDLSYGGMEWNFSDDIHAGSEASGNVITAQCSLGSIEIEFTR